VGITSKIEADIVPSELIFCELADNIIQVFLDTPTKLFLSHHLELARGQRSQESLLLKKGGIAQNSREPRRPPACPKR